MSASAQRRKNREAAARRRAAATEAAKPERTMASFRENAGENRAHQVQNGASAVALAKSGGEAPIADLRGGGGIDSNTGLKLPEAEKPVSVSSSDDKAKPKPEAAKAKPVAQGEPGVLRYPMEALSDTTDYLQIDIVQYKSTKEVSGGSLAAGPGSRNIGDSTARKGLTAKGLATKRLKDRGTIILQMPSQIQDGSSVRYGESEMNSVVGAAAGTVMKVMTDAGGAIGKAKDLGTAVQGSLTATQNALGDLAKDNKGLLDAGKKYLTSSLTASALGALGGTVSAADLLARSEGQVFNPNMELLFNGPTLRSFRFSFKFTPRNAKEAEQVKLIIRTFKSNMAPKVGTETLSGNAIFIKTPNIFELRYRRGIKNHPFLHKFKQCFLTDVSVNYTGEGVYATYDDSTPISMQMDLSFKEIEPIYDQDYQDSDIGVGF